MNNSQVTRQPLTVVGYSADFGLFVFLLCLGVPCAAQTVPAVSQPASATSAPLETTKPSASLVPSMPTIPSFTNLDAKRPICKYGISRLDIPKMEECRNSWETYRIVELEGYNSALKDFTQKLKRLDKKLQRQESRKEISPEQYEDYKEEISDHLQSATTKDGFLLKKYFDFYDIYKNGVRIVQEHYRRARSG